jgi:SAM-dependent methyltransferase
VTSLYHRPAMPSASTQALAEWLGQLPVSGGTHLVSDPVHFGNDKGGEESYAQQFARDEDAETRMAESLARVLASSDTSRPALELGAGTGSFSRALVIGTSYPSYYITDTSPEFLRRTRSTIEDLGLAKEVRYVVLSGDELDRWPQRTLSLIALRFTLHHVLDWQRLIHVAARLLVPGGVLTFEEPCADGFVLQAALANLARRNRKLRRRRYASVQRDLDFFIGTTLFYARDDVDKCNSEDKHVFPVYSLLETCREAGLIPKLYPNQGFAEGLDSENLGRCDFAAEFRHNLAVNFGFSGKTLEFFEVEIAPACSDLALNPAGGGPVVRAVLVATKLSPG